MTFVNSEGTTLPPQTTHDRDSLIIHLMKVLEQEMILRKRSENQISQLRLELAQKDALISSLYKKIDQLVVLSDLSNTTKK
jgi:hypothetical protein